MRSSVDLPTMPQQQHVQSHISSQAYANYAMGPLWVSFLSRAKPPTDSYIIG